MGMNDCSLHNKPSTGRCYTCHRPFCGDCPAQGDCCSAKCAEGKKKFSSLKKVPRKESIIPLLMKIGVVIALVIGGIKYRKVIFEKLGEFF